MHSDHTSQSSQVCPHTYEHPSPKEKKMPNLCCPYTCIYLQEDDLTPSRPLSLIPVWSTEQVLAQ